MDISYFDNGRELLEGIYDLVLETVLTASPEIVIAAYCNTSSWDLVKQGLTSAVS